MDDIYAKIVKFIPRLTCFWTLDCDFCLSLKIYFVSQNCGKKVCNESSILHAILAGLKVVLTIYKSYIEIH
jgi:hypothetical protein